MKFKFVGGEEDMSLWEAMKSSFWRIPLLSGATKDSIYYFMRALVRGKKGRAYVADAFLAYTREVLEHQNLSNQFSINDIKEIRAPLTDKGQKLFLERNWYARNREYQVAA